MIYVSTASTRDRAALDAVTHDCDQLLWQGCIYDVSLSVTARCKLVDMPAGQAHDILLGDRRNDAGQQPPD